jgi:hypothetical protein
MYNPEELATYGTLDKINVREYRRGNKNGQSREYHRGNKMDNPEELATYGTLDKINAREYRRGKKKWTIQRIPKGQ